MRVTKRTMAILCHVITDTLLKYDVVSGSRYQLEPFASERTFGFVLAFINYKKDHWDCVYTGKLIRVGFLVQIRDLFPIFLLSLSMGMVVYLVINIMALPYLLSLIFGVVIGVVYYVSLSRLFRFKEWKELMGLIGR